MAIKEQNQDLNSDSLAPESTHYQYATVAEGERQQKGDGWTSYKADVKGKWIPCI